jgi:hypothetical protein
LSLPILAARLICRLIFPGSLRRLRPIFKPTLNLPGWLLVDLTFGALDRRDAQIDRRNRIHASRPVDRRLQCQLGLAGRP